MSLHCSIPCKMALFDKAAEQHASARSCAGVALGFILIPVFSNEVCVGRTLCGTKGRKWIRYIKECTMKHVVSGWLLGCAKSTTQLKLLEPKACAFDDLSHAHDTRKMCVFVTLCTYDEVFCLHSSSRARHSLMSVHKICVKKKLHVGSPVFAVPRKVRSQYFIGWSRLCSR